MPKLSIHPLAKEFPLMSAREYEALKADIKENGLQKPILLYQGKILDGRNRYKACQELRRRPKTEQFKGSRDEARAFVTSANLLRRHLSKSQKAMFLVVSGLVAPPPPDGTRRKYGTGLNAIMALGKRYGVNHLTIYKAAAIHANDPKLSQKVLRGELSVPGAEIEFAVQEAKKTKKAKKARSSRDQKAPRSLTISKAVREALDEKETPVDAAVDNAAKAASQFKRALKIIEASELFPKDKLAEARRAINTAWTLIRKSRPA